MKPTLLHWALIGTTVVWTATSSPAQQPATRPATQPSAVQIELLIKQLGDERFRARQEAEDRLVDIGDAARPLLAKLLAETKDPEVRSRAESALREMSRKGSQDVDGVQLRIRLDKTSWPATEIPSLLADLRNGGSRYLAVDWGMGQLQLELDGKWYKAPFQCLRMLNTTDKAVLATTIDEMLASARNVEKASAGTPLQAASQTVIEALTAVRHAVRDQARPAGDLEETKTAVKAVVAMVKTLAGLPVESAPK
ncbi:MAG: HEAT repeat domain-containing protein [Tepidisphaerales bacterium]